MRRLIRELRDGIPVALGTAIATESADIDGIAGHESGLELLISLIRFANDTFKAELRRLVSSIRFAPATGRLVRRIDGVCRHIVVSRRLAADLSPYRLCFSSAFAVIEVYQYLFAKQFVLRRIALYSRFCHISSLLKTSPKTAGQLHRWC